MFRHSIFAMYYTFYCKSAFAPCNEANMMSLEKNPKSKTICSDNYKALKKTIYNLVIVSPIFALDRIIFARKQLHVF